MNKLGQGNQINPPKGFAFLLALNLYCAYRLTFPNTTDLLAPVADGMLPDLPMIVSFAKMAKECEALLDLDGEYASINTNCFYSPNSETELEFVGAFCNSKLFMFIYDLFFGALRMSGGYYQFQAPQLRVIPF